MTCEWRAARGLALALALAASAACDRPSTLVICHNSNCVGAADPDDDDTPGALVDSLALRTEGRPTLDGIELDTMWYRATSRCLFEHGPGRDLPQDTAAEAAAVIAAHLARPDVAWNGERFYVVVELKGYVGARFERHTDDEAARHADCAIDIYDTLVAARGAHRLQFIFEAEPRLLAALAASPRWPGRTRGGDVEVLIAGESGAVIDSLVANPRIASYPELDVVEYLAGATTDAQLEAYRSISAALCLWSYATTPEVLRSLERHEPTYVLASEAAMLRRWLTR